MSVQENIQPIHSYSNNKHSPKSIAGLAIDRKQSATKSVSFKKLILVAAIIMPIGAYYFLSDDLQGANFQGTNAQATTVSILSTVTNNNVQPTEGIIDQALVTEIQQRSAASDPQINKTVSNNKAAIKVLDASGHIVARRIATVSSRITGKLNKLYIEEGQVVVKDQILAELDNEQALINYQLSLAELEASQANVAELVIVLQYEQQRLTRRQALVKSKLISTQLADDSQLKTKQLSAQLVNKKALASLAKHKVALANYQLNHHKIRAPFNGVVISKNAQVGELISTGSSAGGSIRTGVGTIVDMDSLEIEVEVGESYINRVYAGQQVKATLDAYPNWQINSEVIAVIPTADKQKASIKVRIKLLEKDPRVFPDMSVKVSFLGKPQS